MSERRRIWITGLGLITAAGTGLESFRSGLRDGRSPIERIDRFDPAPFRSQVAAQVDDFDPIAWWEGTGEDLGLPAWYSKMMLDRPLTPEDRMSAAQGFFEGGQCRP